MKINKQFAFASFDNVFIKIGRSKVRESAWILEFFKNMDSQPCFSLSYLNQFFIRWYKRNWFIALREMKINKQFAFAQFEKELTEIERSKVRASDFTILVFYILSYYYCTSMLSIGTVFT